MQRGAGGPERAGVAGLGPERLSDDFKEFEKPRGVALIAEDFTIANGLLTPTLKLKRAEAVARYQNVIADLYAGLRAA